MRPRGAIVCLAASLLATAAWPTMAAAGPMSDKTVDQIWTAATASAMWIAGHAREAGAEAEAMQGCIKADALAAPFDYNAEAAGTINECRGWIYDVVNKKAPACSYYKAAIADYRRVPENALKESIDKLTGLMSKLGC